MHLTTAPLGPVSIATTNSVCAHNARALQHSEHSLFILPLARESSRGITLCVHPSSHTAVHFHTGVCFCSPPHVLSHHIS